MTGTGRPPRRLAVTVALLVTLVVLGASWVVDRTFVSRATPPLSPGSTVIGSGHDWPPPSVSCCE